VLQIHYLLNSKQKGLIFLRDKNNPSHRSYFDLFFYHIDIAGGTALSFTEIHFTVKFSHIVQSESKSKSRALE